MNKMDVVAPILDGLQRLATLHDVAVIATVGVLSRRARISTRAVTPYSAVLLWHEKQKPLSQWGGQMMMTQTACVRLW